LFRAILLELKPPETSIWPVVRAAAIPQDLQVSCRDLLGGLIHEYDVPSGRKSPIVERAQRDGH
jgi:hypothetical protein